MISALKLKDFRNFQDKKIIFSKKITVLVGPNASGKTNILEAINLLSSGKSFKAKIEEEMIGYDAEIARVSGKVGRNHELTNLEVVLSRGVITRGNISERIARKRLLVEGVGKRLIDFSGIFTTVVFRPADLDLVTESPSLRRRFLDGVLSQVDREYRRALLSYEKGIRRRNKLLLRIRDEGGLRSHLYFWDKLVIKNGQYLTGKREEFIDFVNNSEKLGDGSYHIDYDRSTISVHRLLEYKREEIAAGTTLVGPHRDDMVFLDKKRDLAKFGSRGEQRVGVLWLKLAELSYIREETGDKPTLLLDDIFSELDHEHRALVGGIAGRQQTIITTADPHHLEIKGKFEKILL